MGSSEYDFGSRKLRSSSLGYETKSRDEIFTQNKARVIHESMKPKGALLRESRDSETHPLSVPIIIALDVTGSMGNIPHDLVREGLPKLMSNIIQKGIKDPQILFLAIGDVECDNYPLQVGQFESGDLELDTWLTRVFIEQGGGANEGESYNLAWYYAAHHTVTDSWEKRKQKGFIFTIGDEPCLSKLPSNVINELMGQTPQKTFNNTELLELAREKYDVYHLQVMEGSAGRRSIDFWKNLMGQNCIRVDDQREISTKIADIVVSHTRVSEYDNLLVDSVKVNTTSSPIEAPVDENML